MDRFLLIETSGRVGRIGIAAGPNLLAGRALDEMRRHARDLAPNVADLLRDHGWGARHLTAVFVGLGPGSYTGLRVGVMSAKAIAFAAGCALVGVPTFAVLARQANTPAMTMVVVGDAQQDQVYVQAFGRGTTNEVFRPVDDLCVISAEQFAARLQPGIAVGGPGVDKVGARLPAGTAFAAGAGVPTLDALLSVGRHLLDSGAGDDPMRLEPLYLRRSSAEEQWDRRPSP
jgi:tRNA threonylcarbamoyladenosine biosynthesis protein TsaB